MVLSVEQYNGIVNNTPKIKEGEMTQLYDELNILRAA